MDPLDEKFTVIPMGKETSEVFSQLRNSYGEIFMQTLNDSLLRLKKGVLTEVLKKQVSDDVLNSLEVKFDDVDGGVMLFQNRRIETVLFLHHCDDSCFHDYMFEFKPLEYQKDQNRYRVVWNHFFLGNKEGMY